MEPRREAGILMNSTVDSLGCLATLLLIGLVVVAVIIVAPQMINSAADHERAMAEHTIAQGQARAIEIQARADLEYTRGTTWQEKAMTFTLAITALKGDSGLWMAIAAALLGSIITLAILTLIYLVWNWKGDRHVK